MLRHRYNRTELFALVPQLGLSFEPQLEQPDRLLDDDEVVEAVRAAVARRSPRSRSHWPAPRRLVQPIRESFSPVRAGGLSTKRIRHSPERIIREPREADAESANGAAVPETCKALGIAGSTYYRWRNRFGGIKADEVKRLKGLEKENARHKALVADLSLGKAILEEAARGNP